MSYREMRNMVEMLRALDYPRIVSVENFRIQNFKLVAEILNWIIARYDPNSTQTLPIETEQERIIFVKFAVLTLMQKACLKLNPKKLYQADGYAAQELTVPIRALYDAARHPVDSTDGTTVPSSFRNKFIVKLQELRSFRQILTQLPQNAATIYDLLSKETIARAEREKALSFALNVGEIEKTLRKTIEASEAELIKINQDLANIKSDEATLDAKIERKKREYEQQEKRLAKIQNFRPQYMDEYEKHETKLKELYSIYVTKFRNVHYLKLTKAEYDKTDRQKCAESEQNMRNMVERMRATEISRRTKQMNALAKNESLLEISNKETRMYGSMTGVGISDDDEDDEDDEDEIDFNASEVSNVTEDSIDDDPEEIIARDSREYPKKFQATKKTSFVNNDEGNATINVDDSDDNF